MNCKNFKIRQKDYKKIFYCIAKRKEIDYHNCSKKCKRYEKKIKKSKLTNLNKNKKSKKLEKLEKDRFSLFSNNINKCYLCPSTTDLTWHEIFRGKNRSNSMKYGLCLRLCYNCHERYQENKNFNDYWHKQAQIMFIRAYPNLDFLEIFKKNYL